MFAIKNAATIKPTYKLLLRIVICHLSLGPYQVITLPPRLQFGGMELGLKL
jgi:hypothetical protein